MAAAKVADAFSQLSPKGNGIVPWRVLEEFLNRLDVEPKAIQACKCVQELDGTVRSDKLYSWLYDDIAQPADAEALEAPPPHPLEVVEEDCQAMKCASKPAFPDELPYEKGLRLHYAVPAWKWCVTRRGFLEFLTAVTDAHKAGRIENRVNPSTQLSNPYHDDPDIGPNMHTVNGAVIKPRTSAAGGMSWALMLNPEGLDGDFFFVTHSWKEGVYEFSRKVVHHWQDQDLSMWCCFLANPQTWDREELNQLLGERFDLSDSPFMKALSASQLHSFVVVPNVTESLYCRLWCVAELWKAMEVEKQRAKPLIFVAKDTIKKAPDTKGGSKDSISTMIQHATCSDENDERRIRAYIQGNEHHLQDEIKNLALRAKQREKEKMSQEKERKKEKKSRKSSRGAHASKKGTLGALEAELEQLHGFSFEESREEYRPPVEGEPQEGIRTLTQQECEAARIELVEMVECVPVVHELVASCIEEEPEVVPAPIGALQREEDTPVGSAVHHRESEVLPSEAEARMFQRRLENLRLQTEYQRRADDDTERLLFDKIQLLSQELSARRQSIEVRHHKESDKEAHLRRQIEALNSATVDDLRKEIILRKEFAAARERILDAELARLVELRDTGTATELPEKDAIDDCMSKLENQRLLRIQLEALLESGEGEDTLRRHLTSLKSAEFEEFLSEVKLHRQSDEATEAFLFAEVESLGSDLQRHKAESDARRAQAQAYEAEIVQEMERFQKLQHESREREEKESLQGHASGSAAYSMHDLQHVAARVSDATPKVTDAPVTLAAREADRSDDGSPINRPFVSFGVHTATLIPMTPVVAVLSETEGVPTSLSGWSDAERTGSAEALSPSAAGASRTASHAASTGAESEASSDGEEEQEGTYDLSDEDDRLNDLFDI